MMRCHLNVVSVAVTILILAGGLTASVAASADAGQSSALYVNVGTGCDDSGPGSQAVPFCTVQAAANVVDPGQTVYIENATALEHYTGNITITRSGTAAAPITFSYLAPGTYPDIYPAVASEPTVTLKDVKYVNLDGLYVYRDNGGTGVEVSGSSDITLSSVAVYVNATGVTPTKTTGIEIDGTSSAVTVSRSVVNDSDDTGVGIQVQPGASQILLTTNSLDRGAGTGVVMDGAVDSAVTSNTLWAPCGAALSIMGSGSSVTAENNELESPDETCTAPSAALTVNTAAAPGTVADYNALLSSGTNNEYSWAGTTYATAAAFSAATGQGAHDVNVPLVGDAATAPIIDSANCFATGELGTDINGLPRVRDPQVPDTGNGTCYADRGASERQDPLGWRATWTGLKGGTAPFTVDVTVTLSATSPWGEPVTYTLDWGDGSAPVTLTPGVAASHTYATPGRYTLSEEAADTGGSIFRSAIEIPVGTVTTPAVALTVGPEVTRGIVADSATFGISTVPAADAFEVASENIAFGDSTSSGAIAPDVTTSSHDYQRPGTYTASITQTDLLGRTSTATARVTVGEEYQPVGPYLDYSRRIPADGVAKLSAGVLHTGGLPGQAAYVSVTVSGPTRAGYLSVYPDGEKSSEAVVRFKAGQTVSGTTLAVPSANSVTDFFNGSGGALTLTVRSYGSETASGTLGDTYVPVGPVRELPADKVAANSHVTFRASGVHGVPATAAAVVLDVSATATKAAGFMTAFGDGAANPGIHDVDWTAGQTVTGLAVVPLRDGKAQLKNGSKGAAEFTADAVGYFEQPGTGQPGSAASVFLPTAATRLATLKIAPRHAVKVAVSGKGGLPATGISAALADLTATGGSRSGTITGWPDGATRPGTAALSYLRGETTVTAVLIPVGADGALDLYNAGSSTVTVTVDLTGGYYRYPNR